MKTNEVLIDENVYIIELGKDIQTGQPFIFTGKNGPELIIAENKINVHDNSTHALVISVRKKNPDDIRSYASGKMTRKQFLLVKLSEECNEVSQRALKALLFGMEEKQPEQELDNKTRLYAELNDLMTIVKLMQDEGMVWQTFPDPELVRLKKSKVEHYYEYSRKLGIVE